MSSLTGEVVSEEYDWYFGLAGDIVSKATSSAWPAPLFTSRKWEYALVDSSLSRRSVGDLCSHRSACVVLLVIKVPFDPEVIRRESVAFPLGHERL